MCLQPPPVQLHTLIYEQISVKYLVKTPYSQLKCGVASDTLCFLNFLLLVVVALVAQTFSQAPDPVETKELR